MAYDEGLAQRIRELVQHKPNIVEKKMFGGIAFMAYDYMFLGVVKNDLMARVGPINYAAVLVEPHVVPMDFTGKPMVGYVFVQPLGFAEDEQLQQWIDMCFAFVRSLPVKVRKLTKA
jgi:hypothetical protein